MIKQIIVHKNIFTLLFQNICFSNNKVNIIIPIKEMVKFIGKNKVLEIGAGRGLFAYLLSLENVDIVATDFASWRRSGFNFMKIEERDYLDSINKYSDRSVLIIIWPPYYDKDSPKKNQTIHHML